MKKILGFTEDFTSCDCCGKADLKGTYAIELNGVLSYFGSVCAFKIHAVDYEEQKEIKSAYNRRKKSSEKLTEMESENRTDAYHITKMLKFVEAKKLDLNAFILKYGENIEENNFAIWYSVGNVVRAINK